MGTGDALLLLCPFGNFAYCIPHNKRTTDNEIIKSIIDVLTCTYWIYLYNNCGYPTELIRGIILARERARPLKDPSEVLVKRTRCCCCCFLVLFCCCSRYSRNVAIFPSHPFIIFAQFSGSLPFVTARGHIAGISPAAPPPDHYYRARLHFYRGLKLL